MTGGMAYEALNNLGHSGRGVIIVLNDNGRSYAPTVSNLVEEPGTQIRLNPVYMRRQATASRQLRARACRSSVARARARASRRSRPRSASCCEPPAFFEALGVRYVGPFDGHDIEALEQALRNAAEFDGPIVVHVLTQKGRGYPPAEDDDEKHLHDAPVFDPAVGPPHGGADRLHAGVRRGDHQGGRGATRSVVAITAAMPGPTGLLPVPGALPRPLLRRRHRRAARRHRARPAWRWAGCGRSSPSTPRSSTGRGTRSIYDVALHRLPVVFCLDRAGITGDDGPSHHGVYDMALLTKVPGMTVFAPSSCAGAAADAARRARARRPVGHPLPEAARRDRSATTRSAVG